MKTDASGPPSVAGAGERGEDARDDLVAPASAHAGVSFTAGNKLPPKHSEKDPDPSLPGDTIGDRTSTHALRESMRDARTSAAQQTLNMTMLGMTQRRKKRRNKSLGLFGVEHPLRKRAMALISDRCVPLVTRPLDALVSPILKYRRDVPRAPHPD